MKNRILKSIILLIGVFLCGCSCVKTWTPDVRALEPGYFTDVYVPNDSVVFYLSCTVSIDRAELQQIRRIKRRLKSWVVENSLGEFEMKKDTVIVDYATENLTPNEFKELLKEKQPQEWPNGLVDLGNGISFTQKLFNDLYKIYIY